MKKVHHSVTRRGYINVMESLVIQEVDHQLQQVTDNIRRYVNADEVITYALNRLPALYASSERGREYQSQRGQRNLHRKIKEVVRQAIAAVQVDPIRLSQPIEQPQAQLSEAVLQTLRTLFGKPDLDWAMALQKLDALKDRHQQRPPRSGQPESQPPWPSQTPRYRAQRLKSRQRLAEKKGTPISIRAATGPSTEQPSASPQQPTGRLKKAGWEDSRYQL